MRGEGKGGEGAGEELCEQGQCLLPTHETPHLRSSRVFVHPPSEQKTRISPQHHSCKFLFPVHRVMISQVDATNTP